MNRRGALGALFAAVASAWATAAPAPPAAPKAERAQVQEQLLHQKAALDLIRNQKVSTLGVLELVEHMQRRAASQVRSFESDLKLMRDRVQLAERQQAAADHALQEQIQILTPRLTLMYRTMQRNPLEALLSAKDFAQLVWRSRALSSLLEGDLKLLRDVQRVRRFQASSRMELDVIRGEMDQKLQWARAQQGRAVKHRQDLQDLLSLLQAEAVQSGRVIRELEQADGELQSMVAEMEAAPAATGFGALKGKLAWPVIGKVELGFGKVENPRFHTVTVQKGVDLRAAVGVPVRAVADGKVAFSGWLRGYGNVIILDHGDGYHTVAAHLDSLERRLGDEVKQGEAVGPLGDSGSLKGAYLYFELRHRGVAVDPLSWLRR